MNEFAFRNLILELMEENPFALRTVLKILEIKFIKDVKTLAITREERPRLLVNLDFVNANCRTEAEVKAVICHEFLHVLLRHTEKIGVLTEAEHLAMDAVINAIIHRELGSDYSSMMSNYYRDAKGLLKILRPMNEVETDHYNKLHQDSIPQSARAWAGLYEGKLVVDDIKELAQEIIDSSPKIYLYLPSLLGNHQDLGIPLPPDLEKAMNETMKVMNGHGIWRSPKSRGVGASPYELIRTEEKIAMENWVRATLSILKKHLVPDRKAKKQIQDQFEYHIPVLSQNDRRAFLTSLWSSFIPEATWTAHRDRISGLAQVYLDVSGSMTDEMPQIIALLNRLRRYIKMPFWAFSTEVVPARIESGQLVTNTSGGTSMLCVLEHIGETRPASAVIITDGYIEDLQRKDLLKIKGIHVHVIVSRTGSASILSRIGMDYTQLDGIPK